MENFPQFVVSASLSDLSHFIAKMNEKDDPELENFIRFLVASVPKQSFDHIINNFPFFGG